MLNALRRMFVGPWTSTILSQDTGGDIPYVAAENALRWTPVYRATTLISADIGRIPVEVSAAGADSLMRSPSTWMNAFEFRRTITMHALLWGNGFAAINLTRGGELVERQTPGLGLHHHSGAAAVRRVVDRPMAVMGPVSQIVDLEIEDAGAARPAEQRQRQTVEVRREDGDDVDAH